MERKGGEGRDSEGFLLFVPWPLVIRPFPTSPSCPSSKLASDPPRILSCHLCHCHRGYKRDVEFKEMILESSGLQGIHLMVSGPRSIG